MSQLTDKEAAALYLAYEKAKEDIAQLREKLKTTPFRKVIAAEKSTVRSGSGVHKKKKTGDAPAKKKKAKKQAPVSGSALCLLVQDD